MRRIALLLSALALCLALSASPARAETYVTGATTYGHSGDGFAYQTTASGAVMDPYAYTAAHPYLPFGTVVAVCHEACVDVVVTDRGPYGAYTPGGTPATLDLSYVAALDTGLYWAGVDEVRVYH